MWKRTNENKKAITRIRELQGECQFGQKNGYQAVAIFFIDNRKPAQFLSIRSNLTFLIVCTRFLIKEKISTRTGGKKGKEEDKE